MVFRCYHLWDVFTKFLYSIVEMCHWDILVGFHWNVGCFIWDIHAMPSKCTDRSPWHLHDVFLLSGILLIGKYSSYKGLSWSKPAVSLCFLLFLVKRILVPSKTSCKSDFTWNIFAGTSKNVVKIAENSACWLTLYANASSVKIWEDAGMTFWIQESVWYQLCHQFADSSCFTLWELI